MWTDIRIRGAYHGVSGGSEVRKLFCGRVIQFPLTWGIKMFTILVVLLVVLLIGGGGWGYSRWR